MHARCTSARVCMTYGRYGTCTCAAIVRTTVGYWWRWGHALANRSYEEMLEVDQQWIQLYGQDAYDGAIECTNPVLEHTKRPDSPEETWDPWTRLAANGEPSDKWPWLQLDVASHGEHWKAVSEMAFYDPFPRTITKDMVTHARLREASEHDKRMRPRSQGPRERQRQVQQPPPPPRPSPARLQEAAPPASALAGLPPQDEPPASALAGLPPQDEQPPPPSVPPPAHAIARRDGQLRQQATDRGRPPLAPQHCEPAMLTGKAALARQWIPDPSNLRPPMPRRPVPLPSEQPSTSAPAMLALRDQQSPQPPLTQPRP